MKKRLLSAVLALAMALTLIPATVVPAFAVTSASPANRTSPESGRTQVQYVNGTDFSKPTEPGTGATHDYVTDAWTWSYVSTTDNKTYWAEVPHGSMTGIVSGTNASGTWYASATKLVDNNDPTKGITLCTSSFTLLEDLTLNPIGMVNCTNVTVNTFGSDLTFTTNSINKVTNITITDTYKTQYGKAAGSVTGLTRDVHDYTPPPSGQTAAISTSGLTLSVTGADVAGISLTGRSNNVTLTDVALTGGITLNGVTTVNNPSNGTSTVTYDSQRLTISPKTTAPYTKSTVGGDITVTGNNSTIALNGVTTTDDVIVNGVGGTVTLGNGASVGDITVAQKSTANNTSVTTTSAPASVTINDATAASYSYAAAPTAGNTGSAVLTVNAQGKVTTSIETKIGTVNIHSANVGTVAVKSGTLNIDGTNGKLGAITLGDSTATKVALNFSGTGYTGDNIMAQTNAVLTIGNNWPVGRSNTFGALDLKNYSGQGIKGGIFKSIASDGTGAAKSAWFSPDLLFMRKFTPTGLTGDYYAYYGTRELAAAIADAGTAAKTSGQISVVGYLANSATPKDALFFNSMVDVGSRTQAVASLTYGASTAIYLPDRINGTQVATWTNASDNDGVGTGTGNGNSTATIYSVNELVPLLVSSSDVKFVLQGSSAAVNKLTNVTASGTNSNVTVTLSNNQITLSGAVGMANVENIEITCTTDVVGPNGNLLTFNVPVAFNPTTKTATIGGPGTGSLPAGVTINNSTNTIQVGNNVYTLSVSGLVKPAPSLKVAGISGTYGYTSTTITGKGIVATVSASMGNSAKEELIGKIAGPNDGTSSAEFDWTVSPAMQQVVNQAMTTVTNDNQIDNWAAAAQRAAWNQLNRGKSPNTDDLLTTGYTDVVLEPYLAVNVTAYNQSGVMTATLTPSYRVIVVNPNASDDYVTACKNKTGFTAEGYYIAQQGRALGTPITDLTDSDGDNGVKVTFNDLPTGFGNNTVMHQDGTYVYSNDSGTYTITRAGKTGLGTVVFNTTPALIELTRAAAATNVSNGKAGTYYYDNLQAAVDDTLPQADDAKQDKITVTAAYTDSGVINVTGTARTFKIETKGQTNITRANENFLVGVDAGGHQYTVQLQQSVATVDGTVEIAVAPTLNGTVVPNVSKAKAGQTVTVTVVPTVAGQVAKGVTVTTNNGTVVPATATGKTNEYSFVVPQNTTSITVTPNFAVTTANFAVSTNQNLGTAVVNTGTADGTAQQGSTVTVTTVPSSSSYRTVGLTARGNNGASASVTRTGTNTFNVTVPAGATTVTVAPSFDYNTGTPFADVLSTHWASSYVTWAYQNKYIEGTGTFTYSPNNPMSRGEVVTMLYKAAGSPSVVGMSNPFVDIGTSNATYWGHDAVVWAYNQGLISAGTGYFNPYTNATRAEIVEILYKRAGSPTVYGTSGFADVASNASYSRAVTWARQKGLTNGYSGNTYFRPGYAVDRAQMAAFLQRAFSK